MMTLYYSLILRITGESNMRNEEAPNVPFCTELAACARGLAIGIIAMA